MENKVGNNRKILVLLDAHAILHRAFHALPDFTSPKGEPTGALYGFTALLIKVIRELKPDYIAAAYDLPKPTFSAHRLRQIQGWTGQNGRQFGQAN